MNCFLKEHKNGSIKKSLAVILLAMLVVPTASLGATVQEAENQAQIAMMKSELASEGFSQSDMEKMSSEFLNYMKLSLIMI